MTLNRINHLIKQLIFQASDSLESIEFEYLTDANIISKYAGEYLGVIALMHDNLDNVSVTEIEDTFGVNGIQTGLVSFPTNTAEILVDSYIYPADGNKISISSKMHKNGGAASSLLGIYKLLTKELMDEFPNGATIIENIATQPAYAKDPSFVSTLGPIKLAKHYELITDDDISEISRLTTADKDFDILESDNLKSLIKKQPVRKTSLNSYEYSIYHHLLNSIVNQLILIANKEIEFAGIVNAALTNYNYLQLLTKVTTNGNKVSFTYHAKMTNNSIPYLYNKAYFSTGNKGRIGFKLSHA